MLGLDDYGSDNDEDVAPRTKHASSQSKPSSLALPPLSSASSKGLVRAKKKITIGLPSLKPVDTHDELDQERPASKKPRLEAGAGSSSLLSMLPAPKQKNPVAPAPERVLGAGKGPGLVFNTTRAPATFDSTFDLSNHEEDTELESSAISEAVDSPTSSSTTFSFLPPSLAKGKANISLEEGKPRAPPRKAPVSAAPAVDFFSLGSSSRSTLPKGPSLNTVTPTPSSSVTSAPVIPTFEVPEPSLNDPYPGYYQLPTGAWAQHDPVYYERFRKKWEKEYNNHVRALERGTAKGFEGYDDDNVEDVDAAKEMEKAKMEVKEREERKAVTKGAGTAAEKPKMNITAAKLSGRARSRHQLATLLNEAYENREALEEKIAEGRRNRKEAGNKYGF